jgi:hypothetical protein
MTTTEPSPTKAPAAKPKVKTTVKSAKTITVASKTRVTKTGAKTAVKPQKTKAPKVKKTKLVRDSFTIPKAEYLALGVLKSRAEKLAHPAKKSELIRAGIMSLTRMSEKSFLEALESVPAIKTGRPKLR